MSIPSRQRIGGAAQSLGRLLRIALFPTAVSDIAAGIVLGAGVWPEGPGPFLLMGASLCIYHGALALNDWADRDGDAASRPERPIPSGAILERVALHVALILLALGVVLAFGAASSLGARPESLGSAALLCSAALLAVAYDLGPRGPRLGPVLVAGCRALDLAAGLVFGLAGASGGEPWLGVLAVLGYGAYVHQVARLGRLEDGEDLAHGDRPARLLRRIALALVLVGTLPLARAVGWEGRPPSSWELLPLVPALIGAVGLLRISKRKRWMPQDVVSAMGGALRRLLLFTATCALLAGTPTGILVAGLILLGYPLSYGLRRMFPPS